MYPDKDLGQIERRKASIRARIHRRRMDCIELCGELARPVGWIDAGMARWRCLSPWARLAMVPIGLMAGQRLRRGRRTLTRIVQLAPMVVSLVRTARHYRASRSKAAARTPVQPTPIP